MGLTPTLPLCCLDIYSTLFFFIYLCGKALRYELFSIKALSARLRKLTELTKRLIAIIIESFVITKINGN